MNTGVYQIRNTVNGKLYIGSTSTLGFKRRWWGHRTPLRANRHPNQHLQYAWNKYGETAFKFEILEQCFPSDCISREQYYIDTLHPQYNILKTAGSPLGHHHSDATKILIGNAARGENNAGYLGEFVFYHPKHGYFTGGMVRMAQTFNLAQSVIHRLKNKKLHKSHGWIYVGKHPCKLPSNINKFYYNRIHNNRPIYSFYHREKGMFCGTLPDFIKSNEITKPQRTTIHKLFQRKRKMAWGWIFLGQGVYDITPTIEIKYSEALKQNSKSNNHMDTIYDFSNLKTNEIFHGTLRQLIAAYNLNDKSAREMLGRRKTQLKGWIIKT